MAGLVGNRFKTMPLRVSKLKHHSYIVSGSLFDFGLYIFHNGRALLSRGSGPYFYLPKMESHLEARLWADAFRYAEQRLDLPRGSIKATVLIGAFYFPFTADVSPL